MNKICFYVFLISVAACFSLTAYCEESTKELIDKIESLYKTYNDMKAEFIQESYNATSETKRKATGFYYTKKPNLMRWEYNEPEEQLFLFDGKFLWFHFVEDNQIVKSNIENTDSGLRMFLDFLSSLKKIEEDFSITKEIKDDILKLELKPKKDIASLSLLNVYLKQSTFELVKTEQFDHFENKTTIYFNKIEINKGLKEDKFRFKVPDGVEVIEN